MKLATRSAASATRPGGSKFVSVRLLPGLCTQNQIVRSSSSALSAHHCATDGRSRRKGDIADRGGWGIPAVRGDDLDSPSLVLEELPAARTVDAIVFPAERDAGVVGCDEAAVGDGDTVGVTGKIAQHLRRPAIREGSYDCDADAAGSRRGRSADQRRPGAQETTEKHGRRPRTGRSPFSPSAPRAPR